MLTPKGRGRTGITGIAGLGLKTTVRFTATGVKTGWRTVRAGLARTAEPDKTEIRGEDITHVVILLAAAVSGTLDVCRASMKLWPH